MENRLVKIVGLVFFLIGSVLLFKSFMAGSGRAVMFSVGALFAGLGGAFAIAQVRNERFAVRLKRDGRRVQAQFHSAILNQGYAVNGKHPYRMRVQYRDPVTHLVSTYESQNIWFDPTDHMQGRTVTVYIDKHDASKYYVDTSVFADQVSP